MKTVIEASQNEFHFDDRSVPAGSVDSRERASRILRRMALIDSRGNIVAVNKDWVLLAEETGTSLNRVGPGVNYLEICRKASSSSRLSRKALTGIHAVLKEEISSFDVDYACNTPSGPAYFRMDVTPITYRNARAAIIHTDITSVRLSKEEDFKRLQQFARRLIDAQEKERQRISRELHDDLGNRIALMALSVRQIMKQYSKNSGTRELDKILTGITDLSTALRNLSHHLHPPHLQYSGINAALMSLREGFESTHGIQMDVVVPAKPPRLPHEVELCIFRISQECLQNIAKHSQADKVSITLEHEPEHIRLTVSDTGQGFVPSAARRKGGLGLQSMEERALGIGGCLMVKSSPGAGTKISLTVPIQPGHVDVHG
jgi:signal transduction histidine kinase